MVMINHKEESRVLIDKMQQVELGYSHATTNTGNVLSSNSDENSSSLPNNHGTDSIQQISHVYVELSQH